MPKCPRCGKKENVHSDELHVKWIHMCYDCGQQWFTDKPREAWIPQNEENPQTKDYNRWLKQYLETKKKNVTKL